MTCVSKSGKGVTMHDSELMSPREIAVLGVMIALVAAMTLIIVPIPATRGYFNLGETMIFFAAFVFGRKIAGLSGAIGAGLIDAIVAPYFLPATLIIKFSEGFVAGTIADALKKYGNLQAVRAFAVEIGGSIMIIGYFLYEAFILPIGITDGGGGGGLGAALIELPWNISQVLIGGLIAILLTTGIEKAYPRIADLRS